MRIYGQVLFCNLAPYHDRSGINWLENAWIFPVENSPRIVLFHAGPGHGSGWDRICQKGGRAGGQRSRHSQLVDSPLGLVTSWCSLEKPAANPFEPSLPCDHQQRLGAAENLTLSLQYGIHFRKRSYSSEILAGLGGVTTAERWPCPCCLQMSTRAPFYVPTLRSGF